MQKNNPALQIFIYLILSTLVVVFSQWIHMLLVYINMIYAIIHVKLNPFFNYMGLSMMVRKVILLILIPVGIASIPALIYRLIRGRWMPYFIELTWVLWFIFILSHLLILKKL